MKIFNKITLLVLICTLSLGLETNALAVTTVQNLFSTKIAIADRSAKTRLINLPSALSDVLLKVSGDSDITHNPNIAAKIAHADTFLQSYSYESLTKDATNQLYLTIQFNKQAILELLTQANITPWNSERPTTIAWITQPNAGKIAIANPNTQNSINPQLEQQAKNLGLPLILPDPTTSNVQVADIYNRNLSKINLASASYKPDVILIGNISYAPLKPNAAISYQSNWTLVYNDKSSSFQIAAPSLDTLAKHVIKQVFTTITNVAIKQNLDQKSQQLILNITNVPDLATQGKIITYLRNLNGITSVDLSDIDDQSITLNIATNDNLKSVQNELKQSGFLLLRSNETQPVTAIDEPITTYKEVDVTPPNTPPTWNYQFIANQPSNQNASEIANNISSAS